MATLFARGSSAIMERIAAYYANRRPTEFSISRGWQILDYVSAGFRVALLGYIVDLLPWSSVKYAAIAGYTAFNVAMAPTLRRSYLTALLHSGAAITSFLLCRWYLLDCTLSIYSAITFYSLFFECWLFRHTALDRPTDQVDEQMALTLARTCSHFVTAALLFRPLKVYQYLFSNFWSCDPVSYLLLKPLMMEFAYELGNMWLSMGVSWETLYESFAAVQKTVRVFDYLYFEYRSRFHHFLRMECRKYKESRDRDGDYPWFDYNLVPVQEDEIRLLYLPRRSWNPFVGGLLRVKLIALPIEEAEEYGYEALSYTWGEEDPQYCILISEMRHKVRRNLYNMLYARSSVFRGRWLWVDALCIDQGNNAEKQSQLSKMRDIYIDADRVVAWLDDTFDAWMAAHTIVQLSNKFQMWRMQPDQFLNSFDRNSPHWKAFMKYIVHSYFTRAWICQEAGLGHDLQFYIGGAYIPYEAIWYAMIAISQSEVISNICQENNLIGNNDIDAIKNCHTIFGLRPWDSETISDRTAVYPLGLILSVCSRFQAKDPRDKIYAFLGISNSPVAKSIPPRPDISVSELFHLVAIKMLESEDDAEYVLPHAGISRLENPSLPSWVPDWVRETRRNSELISVHATPGIENLARMITQDEDVELPRLTDYRYTAGGVSTPMFQVDATGRRLQTLAILIDNIAAQTERAYNHLSLDVQVHHTWLVRVEALAGPLRASAALPRTLVGNRFNTNAPNWRPSEEALIMAYNTLKENLGGVELETLQHRNYRIMLGLPADTDRTAAEDPEEALRASLDFASRMKTMCGGRKLCRTASGRLGIVPAMARVGDVVVVISGLQTPYVLQKVDKPECAITKNWYKLVGECYIDGVMGWAGDG